MWIVHKDVSITATRKEYLSGNEIELGMVDTNDQISDKLSIARQKDFGNNVYGSHDH